MTPATPSRAVRAAFVLPFCLAAHLAAQGPAAKPAGEETKPVSFSATTANLAAGEGGKVRIEVFRWSPDEERERIVKAFREKGAENLVSVLQSLPGSGYVWTDESLGYSVRYAFRQALASGGERVVIATDRPLGSWSGHPWTETGASGSPAYPFTLIELRLNGKDHGEGKSSLSAKVVANDADKTLRLENFETALVLLKNVQGVAARPN